MESRINKYVAQATGLSRRQVDRLISEGQVHINGEVASLGGRVSSSDSVTVNNQPVKPSLEHQTIAFNKPVGYICSRSGQGGKTIYDLLPSELHHLKPIGRLDKDSCGLILLTSDGQLAYELTHPSFKKEKVYLIQLNKQLTDQDKEKIAQGVTLADGPSQLKLRLLKSPADFEVKMSEGRNRQIRRTFESIGYKVTYLNRIEFAGIKLKNLAPGQYQEISI